MDFKSLMIGLATTQAREVLSAPEPEAYEPTEDDFRDLEIFRFRDPIEKFIELVGERYFSKSEWVEELGFVMNQVLDDMTEKRFGKKSIN